MNIHSNCWCEPPPARDCWRVGSMMPVTGAPTAAHTFVVRSQETKYKKYKMRLCYSSSGVKMKWCHSISQANYWSDLVLLTAMFPWQWHGFQLAGCGICCQLSNVCIYIHKNVSRNITEGDVCSKQEQSFARSYSTGNQISSRENHLTPTVKRLERNGSWRNYEFEWKQPSVLTPSQ